MLHVCFICLSYQSYYIVNLSNIEFSGRVEYVAFSKSLLRNIWKTEEQEGYLFRKKDHRYFLWLKATWKFLLSNKDISLFLAYFGLLNIYLFFTVEPSSNLGQCWSTKIITIYQGSAIWNFYLNYNKSHFNIYLAVPLKTFGYNILKIVWWPNSKWSSFFFFFLFSYIFRTSGYQNNYYISYKFNVLKTFG